MILYIILALLSLLILVIVLRAITFKPTKQTYTDIDIPKFDLQKSISNFQKLLQCKTISNYDSSLEDDVEFKKFEEHLVNFYPNVNSKCEKIHIGKRNILYKWKGKSSKTPTVLMSHYDVVPVEESYWDKPPFEAIIENDVIWGRGTLDTKGTLCAIMESSETLLSEDFVPENDIYIAFAGDEEVNGTGQPEIIEYMKENNIAPGFVVDEGGAVVENVFPGVTAPAAVIGISEKGMLNVTFEAKSNGGHASAPPPTTPITELADVIKKVQKNPFKTQLTPPVEAMFDTLGRYSTFGYKILFANLWLFRPVLDFICTKKGGELNALMRTSLVFTKMSGSKAPNVIPPVASVSANLRLIGTDTMDSAVTYLKNVINNENIEITTMNGMNPCTSSRLDCMQWNTISNVVKTTWPEAIVSPYLMIACSDSRHYSSICDYVYRFSAMAMTSEERKSIHGHNEKITVDAFKTTIDFYLRLIKSV